MDSTGGAMSFEAGISYQQFQTAITDMERRVLGLRGTVVKETNAIDQQFSNLGKLAAGYFSFDALKGFGEQLLRVRGEFQGLEIAFGTMLKSKSKADAFLKEGVEFAATTPFSLQDVGKAQKQLLAYGFSAEEIIPALKRLGDISAGLSLPLERLTYLYGTTKTQGRLFAQDLNQYVGSGIPLLDALAKQFGVTEDKVRHLVEEGKVGFAEVKKAIVDMTSGNGIFTGTLDAQGKSLNALRERLRSAYDEMLNDIGQKNEGIATSLLSSAADVVQNYQAVLDILGVVIGTYGGYRAALVIATIAQKLASLEQVRNTAITEAQALAQAQAASSSHTLTLSQIRLAAATAASSQAQAASATLGAQATALATRAQAAFNATMLSNPIVLVGTALATLATAYFVFRKETVAIKTAQEIMASSAKSVEEKFGAQRAEVSSLISVLHNQNIAESQRLIAYNKLKEIAPTIISNLTFEQAKTKDLTNALNEYLTSLKQKIRLEAGESDLQEAYKQEYEAIKNKEQAQKDLIKATDEANKKQKQPRSVGPDGSGGAANAAASLQVSVAKKKLEELVDIENKAKTEREKTEKAYGKIVGSGTLEALKAERKQKEIDLQYQDKESLAYKNTEDAIASLDKAIANLTKTKKQNLIPLTSDEIDAKIKEQRDKLGQQNSRAGDAKIRTEIERLEAQKRLITGELTNDEKRAAKEAEKIGPMGSISYWEAIAKKADEIMQKTPSSQTGKLQQQAAIKASAEVQAEAIRKQYAVKSFDEELSDKRSKYELYQKWVEAYGKQSADNQFNELLKNGQSYLDFLNSRIAELEAKKTKGQLSDKDAQNLGILSGQRDDITGKKSAIDAFNEGLEKARTSAGSLAEYLVILKEKQDALNTIKPTNNNDFAIRRQLAEEIAKTQSELQGRLNQFLTSYASSGDQQLAIQKEFAEKRAALDLVYNKNRGTEYKQALSVIDDAEKQALADFQQRQYEETAEYKKTTKVILEEGRKRLQIQVADQKAAVAVAKQKYGVNSEVYKQALEVLNGLEKQLGVSSVDKVGGYLSYVNQFADSLISLGGDAALTGEKLHSLTNSISLVASSFKEGVTKSELYTTAIQGVIGIFSAITSAAAERKRVETEYYVSLIAQQQQYNLLLNDQATQRTKANENVFVKNYAQELEDGFKKYDTAQENYQKALKKLEEGRAKAGLKDTTDSTKALDLIGKGAGTGAAIGTLIAPGIGTAVGAVVGTIVGSITALFGGAKKKEAEFGNLLALYPGLIQKSKDGVDELNTSLAESLLQQNLVDDSTKQLIQSTIDWQKQMEEARQSIKAIISDLASGLGDNLRNSLVGAFEDGTDAAQAFKKSVSDIMDDLVTKMLFSKALGPEFDKLEKDLAKSLDVAGGGDNNVIDDFARFTDNSKGALAQFNEWLKAYQDAAKASGFDVLKSNSSTAKSNSATGAFKSLTEETGSVLVGQFNAIRISQAEGVNVMRQQLIIQTAIERHTFASSKYNEEAADALVALLRGFRNHDFL